MPLAECAHQSAVPECPRLELFGHSPLAATLLQQLRQFGLEFSKVHINAADCVSRTPRRHLAGDLGPVQGFHQKLILGELRLQQLCWVVLHRLLTH